MLAHGSDRFLPSVEMNFRFETGCCRLRKLSAGFMDLLGLYCCRDQLNRCEKLGSVTHLQGWQRLHVNINRDCLLAARRKF